MTDLNEEYPIYTPPVDISEQIYTALNNPNVLLGVGGVIALLVFLYLLDLFIKDE